MSIQRNRINNLRKVINEISISQRNSLKQESEKIYFDIIFKYADYFCMEKFDLDFLEYLFKAIQEAEEFGIEFDSIHLINVIEFEFLKNDKDQLYKIFPENKDDINIIFPIIEEKKALSNITISPQFLTFFTN